MNQLFYFNAEKVGFEPTMPLRAYRFSRPAPSTTRTPLRILEEQSERCKDNNLFPF